MKNKIKAWFFVILSLFFVLSSVFNNFAFAQKEEPPVVVVVVTAAFVSQRGVHTYEQIMNYVAQKSGLKFEILSGLSYQMTNRLMKENKVTVAFVCGYAYIREKKAVGMELLALPVPKGETEPQYYSYTIVHKDSPYTTFLDLKGRDFEFSDVLSNSGYLLPSYKLAQMGHTPGDFFGSYRFSGSHEKSIEDVATKKTDAAAVDSLVWEYDNAYYPEFTSRTKIIDKSGPAAVVPVVIRGNFDPEKRRRIQEILINMHTDPEGREILSRCHLEKFVLGDDHLYDQMRDMDVLVQSMYWQK